MASAAASETTPRIPTNARKKTCPLDPGVARPAAQAQAEPAQANAVSNLSDHDEGKFSRGLGEREHAAADRGDGKAVEDKRGGVVGEAFPFEHDDEPPWNAQPANDRERRNHIRRRPRC